MTSTVIAVYKCLLMQTSTPINHTYFDGEKKHISNKESDLNFFHCALNAKDQLIQFIFEEKKT